MPEVQRQANQDVPSLFWLRENVGQLRRVNSFRGGYLSQMSRHRVGISHAATGGELMSVARIKPGDWRNFRRLARYYERELVRIRNATSCSASELRDVASLALDYQKCKKLPDWDDLRGQAPDATGTLSSEAFVRKLRDEWQ